MDPGELQVEFDFSQANFEGSMTKGQTREGVGRTTQETHGTTQETTIEIEGSSKKKQENQEIIEIANTTIETTKET